FSGAEIEEAINSALYEAFYDGGDLTTGHVLNSIRQTVPLARTMDEQINRLRSWAEGRARNASTPRQAGASEHLPRKMEF
ncbi:MAG: AAA family ATPase, partial [Proteobacteria bacterium]|nr:AAA family ATPase [Pseudomonadota bacterium]